MSEPMAFGFLDKNIGKIEITNNRKLTMGVGKTISLIASDIVIDNSYITASEGRINIASLSSCEISLMHNGLIINGEFKGGSLHILNRSKLTVNGTGSGDIYMMGGDILINKYSKIFARTIGNNNGGIIDIHANNLTVSDGSYIQSDNAAGENNKGGDVTIHAIEKVQFSNKANLSTSTNSNDAGDINIYAQKISLTEGSKFNSRSTSYGSGGNISLYAEEEVLFSDSIIHLESSASGNAGNLFIQSKDILIINGSGPASQTFGSGHGGQIKIQASDRIALFGINNRGYASTITSFSVSSGNAGDIVMTAKHVLLKDGGSIIASAEDEGNGGNISIHAENGRLEILGVNPHGENTDGFNSRITSQSDRSGKAGDIHIYSKHVLIKDGAYITNSTSSGGVSGTIEISGDSLKIHGIAPVIEEDLFLDSQIYFHKYNKESNHINLSGIYSLSESQETSDKTGGTIIINTLDVRLSDEGTINTSSTGKRDAGDILLSVNKLLLDTKSSVSSESLASEDGGAAGRIWLTAKNDVTIQNNSALTTEAVNTISTDQSLDNGKIDVHVKDQIYIINGKITTSVKGGAGHGGDIEMDSELLVMNHGDIIANAYEGNGGNIHIVADNIVQSADSSIEASSEKGIDGTINIESPDVDVSGGLVTMPSDFLDMSKWLKTQCEMRSQETISRLVVHHMDALPVSVNDLIVSPPIYCVQHDDYPTVFCDHDPALIQMLKSGGTGGTGHLEPDFFDNINDRADKTSHSFFEP